MCVYYIEAAKLWNSVSEMTRSEGSTQGPDPRISMNATSE